MELTRSRFLIRFFYDILFVLYIVSFCFVAFEIDSQGSGKVVHLSEFSAVYLFTYSICLSATIFSPLRRTVYFLPTALFSLFGGGILVYLCFVRKRISMQASNSNPLA